VRGRVTLSLHTRLLLASSVVLAAFLGATGWVLDRAFQASTEAALRDRLQGHLYALLAASDLDQRGVLKLPQELPDPRFSLIGSGLYAEVVDSAGVSHWRSKSLLGSQVAFDKAPTLGQREFAKITSDKAAPLLSLSFTVSWEAASPGERRYTYRAAESLDAYNAEVNRFRRSLWGGLAGAVILLLGVQSVVLRWSLAPVRRVTQDLHAIESGRAQRLQGDYPRELRQLTDNLNGLLANAENHLKRYRDALGNLAHSLKTPLAVLRGAVDGETHDATLRSITREQLTSMTHLIEHQLQRAAASGRAPLGTPVELKPVIQNILAALAKVYAEKEVRVTLDVDTTLRFHGDASDLTEMLGNLLDNAFKWCRQQVQVSAQLTVASGALPSMLEIRVADDGPGIAADMQARVVERGVRADQSTPGHGLGLAMVQDTVLLYRGELKLENGARGGLAVSLSFPENRS